MKKLLTVSAIAALGLSSIALAGGLPEEMPIAPAAVGSADAGVYLGLQGGYGMSNWNIFTARVDNDNGFIGRVFAGYDFNKNFAVELGYLHFFNKAKMKEDNANYNEAKTQTFDLVGKIKAPVADEVNLYGKLGANYMLTKIDVTGTGSMLAEAKTWKEFGVTYGAGIDYSVTPNVIVNLEWLRHNGRIKVGTGSTDTKFQPWTDSFLVGVRYKFDL